MGRCADGNTVLSGAARETITLILRFARIFSVGLFAMQVIGRSLQAWHHWANCLRFEDGLIHRMSTIGSHPELIGPPPSTLTPFSHTLSGTVQESQSE